MSARWPVGGNLSLRVMNLTGRAALSGPAELVMLQRGWAGHPGRESSFTPRPHVGGVGCHRELCGVCLQGPRGLGVGVLFTGRLLTQSHCTLVSKCGVGMGGRRAWGGLQCSALVPDVFLSPLLPPPRFISLIFISTMRFATDGSSPFNPLQGADRLMHVLSSLQIGSRDAPKCEGD